MICIDNSEWMRNGDYSPSRFQAQADAVSLICGAKTQSNPENTVGILTMAGKGVSVLATPTSDLGKILSCMHGLEMGGEMNLAAGILIAQLALKHRQNKNQQQRIIVFAGSPIKHEKKALEIIGKKLKKNNVALDIVDFGEEEDGKPEKLEALLASVNNNDASHIVHVSPSQNALSDVLISTPVFTGDGEGGSGFAAAAAAAAAAGEERARQEADAKRAAGEASTQEEEEEGQPQSDSQNATSTATEKVSDPMDEDDLLKQALALSMNTPGSDSSAADVQMSEATNDDQELALALQMSMQDGSKGSSAPSDVSKVLGDQSFMSSILSSLPGVDPNDPNVKNLLASLPGQSESQQKKDEDEHPKDDE
ncbi:26S proteasome non-ATPase regulatory subunit 4-like protein [Hibiscus syriacus]|uniref:26S proteasome non-ATPase regulatory subunit 4 homolog n=1 Tax=Hibiscus syriacus TaxID=106335 RepID=A0A6A2ZND8_HIBSY|nr:26S proteasome non-ATPase regulatory subunit 4-like protein [Hibiscus syriacus]